MTLRLNGSTSGYVELDAPAVAGTTALTLPATAGTLMLAEGGKILQIVRATDTTTRTTTSTSAVDVTGMSVTITPQKSDSAVLVIATFRNTNENATNDEVRSIFSLTDSSNNALSGAEQAVYGTSSITGTGTRVTDDFAVILGRSTPATISATTYKLRFQAISASCTVRVVNQFTTGQMYAIEVSA